MNDEAEILQRYAKDHSEAAFAELIRRNVDLVYSTALRLVGGDVHRAQDVTQQVFIELARQAKRLIKHPALAGWLYTTTRQMASHTNRTEQRRQFREREAHAMNELLANPASDSNWEQLRPVLDDAMHELREQDRLAVLLRFFQNKSLKEIGAALNLTENAARMRVERALAKLRDRLAHKGVTSTETALALVLAGHAVTAAPSTFVANLAAVSFVGAAAVAGTGLSLVKLMTVFKFQTAVVGALAIAAVTAPLIVQHQAQFKLREQTQVVEQQHNQIASLTTENERWSNLVAQARAPQPSQSDQLLELLRLRGEVARLRDDSQQLARWKNDPTGAIGRVAKVKARLEQMPEEKIPELKFLTDQEWELFTARVFGKSETDEDYRYTFSVLRQEAKKLFVGWLSQALHNYAKANDGYLPADLSQLKPYFTPPVYDANWKPGDPKHYELLPLDDAILQRYRLVQTGKLKDVPQIGFYPPGSDNSDVKIAAQNAASRYANKSNLPWTEPVVEEKAPVDAQFDSLFTVTVYGYSYRTFGRGNGFGSGTFAKAAVGADGVPEMVDPVPVVGRRITGGGGSFSSVGGGAAFQTGSTQLK